MSDVAYITNAAATLTFTEGSKTVTVTGTNPILEGVLRGDQAVDPNGLELALDVVAAATLTLLRNAPTSGTVQFDIAPTSRLRTSLAANAEVTREVYARLRAAVEDNRSIPVISQATAPPGSPADGDRHLVIATATGAFAGKEGYIAQYDAANTRWLFIAPIAGMKVTVDGSAALRIYTGAAWTVTGATAAADVAFTPTGGVAATTVQAAIAEVDSEKVTKASGTTNGRLWRFTDTAGALGQSQAAEDGSGNVTTVGNVTAGTAATVQMSVGATEATVRALVSGGATGWSVGLNRPGDGVGPNLVFASYGAGAWTRRASLSTDGDLSLHSSSLTKTFPGKAVLINAPTAADYSGFDLFTAGTYRARFIASDAAALLDSASGLSILFRPGGSATLTMLASRTISGVPFTLPSYTVATVPSASAMTAGTEIFVTNEAGGAVPAFSDGTNWRRVTDRAVIS